MPDRHSATTVVIPLRSFVAGKHRLTDVLCRDDRSRLIEMMAERVVAAAHDLPILIVHDDESVAEWATSQGLGVLRPSSGNLNGDLEAARDTLAAAGVVRMLIAHADLPLATDLRPIAGLDGLVIVPDDQGDGTNVFALPTESLIEFAYGQQSYLRHYQAALRSGLATTVVHDPMLALDVDEPQDLDKISSSEPYRSQLTGTPGP